MSRLLDATRSYYVLDRSVIAADGLMVSVHETTSEAQDERDRRNLLAVLKELRDNPSKEAIQAAIARAGWDGWLAVEAFLNTVIEGESAR